MHPMTRANLEAALAGEAMTALRYRLFAERACQEGQAEIEGLFESIGSEERLDHARRIAETLGAVGSSRDNLESALEGEVTEHRRLYPMYAAQARRAGDIRVAQLFEALSRDEQEHAERIRAALARLVLEPQAG